MTDEEVMETYLFLSTFEMAGILFGFSPLEWARHLNSIPRVAFSKKIGDAFGWERGPLGREAYQIISRLTTGRIHWEASARCTYI